MEEESTVIVPTPKPARCSNACLRSCLVATNIILWIGGAFFFLLGVFAYNFLNRLFVDGQGLKLATGFPVASMTLGIVTVLIALLINYFIIFSSKISYYMITGVLALIFLFELVYFIVGVDYGPRAEKLINKGFQTAMINYKDDFSFNLELNLVQWLLKCCGAKNYKDWFATSWAEGRLEVPASCCINLKQCHNLEPVMVDDIHIKGCEKKLRRFIKMQIAGLIVLVAFSIISLILGIVLTLTLAAREENKVEPRRKRRRPATEVKAV